MIENLHRTTVNPMNPYLPSDVGVFEETLTVGGKRRRMLSFVPEGVGASTAGIFVLPANGRSSRKVLEESNWVALAQTEERKEKLIVFFLEPEDGKDWNINEAYDEPNGEVAYVEAAFKAAGSRVRYCVHEAKFYLVGYEAGGVVAQMAAMHNPAFYAGLAIVGSPALPSAYLECAAKATAAELGLFRDETGKMGIAKSEIPMPVWLIADRSIAQTAELPEARYWRSAIGAQPKPRMVERNVAEYFRTEKTPYPIDQEIEAYRVWIGNDAFASQNDGVAINRKVWKDFLYPVRRWMANPGGDLRMTADPVKDLGMEYHYELVGGWMREWYIYVPEQVKRNPDKATPLVFACHGYSCSGEIYTGNSCWWKVADHRGFIVIFPSAIYGTMIGGSEDTMNSNIVNAPLPAWNVFLDPDRPDEMVYFNHMLDDVRLHYRIDESRIYATGHSMGSVMTQMLAFFQPETFAAVAPCSGVLFFRFGDPLRNAPQTLARKAVDLPIWMFGGEKEPWVMPHLPELGNCTGETIRAWWELNRMPGEKPSEFSAGWTIHKDRWNDITYEKNNMPMIRYTWIKDYPHATMTEMSYRIWDEFFCKYHREDWNDILYTS